jgi:integrase
MELLGHSQIAVTMNTYSHVVPALRRDAAKKVDAILNPVSIALSNVAAGPKPN